MQISIVVAAAANGVIGRGGTMPWHMPSDLKRFRALTMGKPVVMGRKTFQSLPKPLDGRDNIVISRDPAFAPPGAIVAASLSAALDLAREAASRRGTGEIMIIGGGEVYRAALPLATRVYLSRIDAVPEGDTSFPDLPPDEWKLIDEQPLPRGTRDDYAATILVYERRPRQAAAGKPTGAV